MLVAGRHFQSLQEIDMSDCANVTSPMVEMILEQCPLLEVLVAPILKVCDIMTNSSSCSSSIKGVETEGGCEQKEWACKNLRRLEVQIEIETSRVDLERPFILARLASMKNLTKIGPTS
ncbi:hypothetical protein BGX24_012209 [Mortierella sp. AD032]|nr:hypothetical protein BGX24_012209 [Mortierella sp. AD032]